MVVVGRIGWVSGGGEESHVAKQVDFFPPRIQCERLEHGAPNLYKNKYVGSRRWREEKLSKMRESNGSQRREWE